jgi:hypothetical protein
MNIFRDTPGRRRQQLNPLRTTEPHAQIPNVLSAHGTPGSSSTTLSSPFGHSNYTPVSAVQQYNPQQWGSPVVGSSQSMQFASRLPQEIEGKIDHSHGTAFN